LIRRASLRPLPPWIEVNLVDTETIARVHYRFMADPTPTDVITFQHGEILVCPEIASERAYEEGFTVFEETLLYAIHGMMHLAGWEDRTSKLAKRMAEAQERVLHFALATW
jgi:probable rRNA maturation factor